MKAVVLISPRNLQILDIPSPKLTEEDHILVEVKACGVCGSDIRYFYGENPWAMHTLGYNAPNPANIVLGHEYAGIVKEVNSKKYSHLLGKRVGVQPWKGCGTCLFCKSGRENLCIHTIHTGHGQGWPTMEYYPGAMAELSIAWADHVYEIPDSISFEAVAMSDILGVARHAVDRAPTKPKSDVLCIGGGPAGLFSGLVALHRGASRAFIMDKSTLARTTAHKFDHCIPINPTNDSLEQIVKDKGSGFSAIYDSVGEPELFNLAIGSLEESGSYINMAVQDQPLTITAKDLGCERIITSSSNALYKENDEAIRMIVKKQIEVEKIISHCTTFDGFLDAFALLLKDPKEAFKVVLIP
ncbi:(R,R)-butanediol dehydrogenase [Treponema sp.]